MRPPAPKEKPQLAEHLKQQVSTHHHQRKGHRRRRQRIDLRTAAQGRARLKQQDKPGQPRYRRRRPDKQIVFAQRVGKREVLTAAAVLVAHKATPDDSSGPCDSAAWAAQATRRGYAARGGMGRASYKARLCRAGIKAGWLHPAWRDRPRSTPAASRRAGLRLAPPMSRSQSAPQSRAGRQSTPAPPPPG